MQPNPLALPIAALMRPTELLQAEDSLELAAARLRDCTISFIPVVDGTTMIGAVNEVAIASAMAEGASELSPIRGAVVPIPLINAHSTGAEALRRMVDENLPALAVVDDRGNLLGIASASDLFPKRQYIPTPPVVGGMATPFGVYLTTGSIGAGAKGLALVATGALMFTLLAVALTITEFTLRGMDENPGLRQFEPYVTSILPILLFFIGLRLIPLSGIHAAEHQVVHAIERGERLVPEVVKRMPRVHPRCGTNVAVGASLFMGIATSDFIPWEDVKFLVAGAVTLFCWRPIGNALQYWVTTKPASDKQIQMGIRSATELLDTYRIKRGVPRSIWVRIWNSGILHVVTGSSIAGLVLKGVADLFNLPIPI